MLFVIPMYSVPELLHTMYTKYSCSFIASHHAQPLHCHPERSSKFAERTSNGVEGPASACVATDAQGILTSALSHSKCEFLETSVHISALLGSFDSVRSSRFAVMNSLRSG